ncbi:thioredoxin domain-containing protein [Paenibacillus sp. LMG 31456]|uniref:Thioredoxin domain-containing protein n=1 Tax=Paenibacillus foliorum TaxID=2654974 RepID=A0A972K240_9BACL|nr:thioredoxin domain-containing protein [Paenibacillus foliorum]NOU96366.1 thioredoxin domain-containing protein [Paenibacillus foliorum]
MKKNTANKASYKEQRKLEAQKQQRTTRRLIWITVIFIVAIIAAVIIFQPKAAPVEIAYDTMPSLGAANAPVKIVELGDYKCPSCQYFSQQLEPQIKKDYIDKGLASFHFMNFTIIGPDSNTAALAGQSVFHQNNDAYWKFYDALYKNQGDEKVQWATPQFLVDLAKKENLPIDYDKLMLDITSKKYQNEVDAHNAFARKNQVNSTPTLFINGKKFDNSMDYNSIKAAIDKAVKGE